MSEKPITFTVTEQPEPVRREYVLRLCEAPVAFDETGRDATPEDLALAGYVPESRFASLIIDLSTVTRQRDEARAERDALSVDYDKLHAQCKADRAALDVANRLIGEAADEAMRLTKRAEEAERKLDMLATEYTAVQATTRRLRGDVAAVRAHRDDVWFWQGDGEDNTHSLVCPVVMRAETCRALDRELASMRKVVAEVERYATRKMTMEGMDRELDRHRRAFLAPSTAAPLTGEQLAEHHGFPKLSPEECRRNVDREVAGVHREPITTPQTIAKAEEMREGAPLSECGEPFMSMDELRKCSRSRGHGGGHWDTRVYPAPAEPESKGEREAPAPVYQYEHLYDVIRYSSATVIQRETMLSALETYRRSLESRLSTAREEGRREALETAAKTCERMVIGGRAWNEGQQAAAEALFAAAKNIREGVIGETPYEPAGEKETSK